MKKQVLLSILGLVGVCQSQNDNDDSNYIDFKPTTDPRIDICTVQELQQATDYFTEKDNANCPGYECVNDKTQTYFESLSENYPELWDNRGNDDEVYTVASLLAACSCRCEMMACEVDYMSSNASLPCAKATIDYCQKQNFLFVQKCGWAADTYPLTVIQLGQNVRWKSLCPNACELKKQPATTVEEPSEIQGPVTVEELVDPTMDLTPLQESKSISKEEEEKEEKKKEEGKEKEKEKEPKQETPDLTDPKDTAENSIDDSNENEVVDLLIETQGQTNGISTKHGVITAFGILIFTLVMSLI